MFTIKRLGYILVILFLTIACGQKEKPTDGSIPEGGYRRVVVDATVYRGLMRMLGVADRCIDFSDEMNPNVEEIAAMKPDLLMISAYQGRDLSKYRKLGIRIIECRDFDEPSALERLKWIKYFGRLWGVGPRADSLYATVFKEVRKFKSPIGSSAKRVLFDLPYAGQWYQPKSQSTTGSLITAAGAKVIGAMSREQILSADPDIWIIRYGGKSPLTLKSLGEMDPFFRQLRCWKKGDVWVSYVSENNYYDETPWRPDFLLQDMKHIIQGSEVHGLRYFEKVK